MGPNIRPIARVEIPSDPFEVNFETVAGWARASLVANPTSTSFSSGVQQMGVSSWNNRFSGFQQYRIRNVKWLIIPHRPLVGTTTSSQMGGFFAAWLEDNPGIGAPTSTDFDAANWRPVIVNSDRTHLIEYQSNEPQDLNLIDISTPPNHIVNSTLQVGQHALQIYGDGPSSGLANGVDVALATVRAVYDIEFFGVGGL